MKLENLQMAQKLLTASEAERKSRLLFFSVTTVTCILRGMKIEQTYQSNDVCRERIESQYQASIIDAKCL